MKSMNSTRIFKTVVFSVSAATLVVSLLLVSAPTWAAQCGEATWPTQPGMSNGRFVGTLTATCVFSHQESRQIANLESAIISGLPQQYAAIHSGPKAEEFEGIASQYWDVSSREKQNGDDVEIRKDVHLATSPSHLVMANTSTEIKASGNAAFLKAVTNRFEVHIAQTEGDVVIISRTVEIAKPWYAPSGTFVNRVKSAVRETFEPEAKAVAEDWETHF